MTPARLVVSVLLLVTVYAALVYLAPAMWSLRGTPAYWLATAALVLTSLLMWRVADRLEARRG